MFLIYMQFGCSFARVLPWLLDLGTIAPLALVSKTCARFCPRPTLFYSRTKRWFRFRILV